MAHPRLSSSSPHQDRSLTPSSPTSSVASSSYPASSYPASPPTESTRRSQLTRSIHKIGKLLGSTPQLVDYLPPHAASPTNSQPSLCLTHHRSEPSSPGCQEYESSLWSPMHPPVRCSSSRRIPSDRHCRRRSQVPSSGSPPWAEESSCPPPSSSPTAARRRSLAKVAWTLGEHVPPELVLGPQRRALYLEDEDELDDEARTY
ncbi:hypothetical protein BDV98DRAFT_594337 [Pterulicium gracile]|uniref:Uncharacterized protein n=1 Tax=Pterulicium gracile TaxID=1884261 RepID=A0A5C3QP74_9AGAR|nr:hypothetical protein BDV98DRAFT_594337 [Pterula gracilis]